MPTLPPDVDRIVRRALEEDLGPTGDVTSAAVLGPDDRCRARIEARALGVLAGIPVAERVLRAVDGETTALWSAADGDLVDPGKVIGEVAGRARSILAAERVALNFLTHLSGVATMTRTFVDACAGTESTVLCTRKTLPGLRGLERYAVECGGGRLHRAGLFDGVLIKDNHVAIAGGVAEAVRLPAMSPRPAPGPPAPTPASARATSSPAWCSPRSISAATRWPCWASRPLRAPVARSRPTADRL